MKGVLIDYLSNDKIEDGERYFESVSNSLSEFIRLECLGDICFYRREIAEAIKYYESATRLAPERAIARYLYIAGVKNERLGSFVDAFKYYQAAIETEPSFVDSYVELGGLLVKIGDFEGALKCYEDALKIKPRELINHENLISVLTKLYEGDNERYKVEFHAAKSACEELERAGGLISSDKLGKW
ncbi:tetratricopeptide repeat protein [Pseudomonas palleroniana]|uniref:tetratricopeptide repeat protein n=1 Tax=Pseudomonas palleroniana TaxID=191390 RepID=UPI000A5580B0|nr:tetratricopeptide repeat protein [Pseudomonas palleroniana]